MATAENHITKLPDTVNRHQTENLNNYQVHYRIADFSFNPNISSGNGTKPSSSSIFQATG
jgi:hypothetical protein